MLAGAFLAGAPLCVGLRRPAAAPRTGRAGRHRAAPLRVAGRYAAGSGTPPPPLPPPAAPAAPQQRPPVPQGRRVGVAPPSQPPPQLGGALQNLSGAAAAAVGAQRQQLQEQPLQLDAFTTSVQLPAAARGTEFVFPRSRMMGMDVITRTSGKRLGYVHQMFVDPAELAVVSLYLRPTASSIAAKATEHFRLSELRQLSDVALVHDETVLLNPVADETVGYCRMVGAEVVTETGTSLGRVRDYLFDPDTGAISTVKYDKLGLPFLPQALLSCYSISWQDVVALGPTRMIVRTGTELRAIKENDGIADRGLELGLETLASITFGSAEAQGSSGAQGVTGDDAFRNDEAYQRWYAQHGAAYEAYTGKPLPKPGPPERPQQAPRQAPPAYQQPRALPPPQAPTFAQAVQPQQPAQQQQAAQQQPFSQQMFQPQPQAVPAGGSAGSAGWGAGPPPSQRQYVYPPPAGQAAAPPPQPPYPQQAQQQYQPPPPQQQGWPQYQQAPPAAAPPPPQYRQPPGAAAPRAQQPAPPPAQQALPQNGIPIIDRSPHRRRDADGNYGAPPDTATAVPAARAAQPPPARQQPPAAGWGAAPPAPAAQQQRGPQPPRQAPAPAVVEPDAVIPGGAAQQAQQRGGSSGGLTQLAQYRQL